MSRSSDPKKLALWQRRFQRFSNAGLPVARFCVRERVSVASFYHWRKKLGPQARRRHTPVRGDVFQPVEVVPAARGVSIRLPGGTQIEVRAEHLDAVRAVIAQVARADRSPEAEHARPQGPGEDGVALC
jgi:hypothetical protein